MGVHAKKHVQIYLSQTTVQHFFWALCFPTLWHIECVLASVYLLLGLKPVFWPVGYFFNFWSLCPFFFLFSENILLFNDFQWPILLRPGKCSGNYNSRFVMTLWTLSVELSILVVIAQIVSQKMAYLLDFLIMSYITQDNLSTAVRNFVMVLLDFFQRQRLFHNVVTISQNCSLCRVYKFTSTFITYNLRWLLLLALLSIYSNYIFAESTFTAV